MNLKLRNYLLAVNAIILTLILALGVIPRVASAYQTTILFTRTISAKTADYTIAAGDSGKVFTTTGATGAVIFTLPAASATYTGFDIYVVNTVDQDMTISGTAGELIFKNDVAANTLAYSTSGEKIGGGWHIVCNGAKWICMPLAEEAQTITVTT